MASAPVVPLLALVRPSGRDDPDDRFPFPVAVAHNEYSELEAHTQEGENVHTSRQLVQSSVIIERPLWPLNLLLFTWPQEGAEFQHGTLPPRDAGAGQGDGHHRGASPDAVLRSA